MRILIILIIVVLLPACFLHHEVSDRAAASDAGVDVRVPVSCDPSDNFVSVEIERCEFGQFRFYDPVVSTRGDTLDIRVIEWSELRFEEECILHVQGLNEAVRAGFEERFARIADGWIDVSPVHLEVRDTSLCDGPAAPMCPLAMRAESGPLRPRVEPGEIEVRWGDTTCEGTCGQLRRLEMSRLRIDAEEVASLAQGEVSSGPGPSRFANLRSWNSCTDEGDTISWAYWIN